MRRLLLFLLLTSSLSLSLATEKKTQSGAYKFGVLPYLSTTRLENIYAPVAAELSRALRHKVNFRTSSGHNRFLNNLKQQRYDIALIQPFWYPPAIDQFGYQPLVRMQEPLASLIMVPDNSPLHSISELKGKLIATPPAFAPVVYMARRALKEAGLIPGKDVQLRAFKSVDSCFQQVFIGSADACITPPFAVAVIEEKMRIKLRALLETTSIPNLSIVVHKRIPADKRERLKNIFLSWKQNNAGKKLLDRIKTQGFVPAIDKEYDMVRAFMREIKGM